jgi:hypothetical protein
MNIKDPIHGALNCIAPILCESSECQNDRVSALGIQFDPTFQERALDPILGFKQFANASMVH